MTALKKEYGPTVRTPGDAATEPGQWPKGEAECFPLDPLPSHIKPRYRRLALISHADHMKNLDPADNETLIVSCDWLLWQMAMTEKRHCLYYERGLLEWTEPDDLGIDLHLLANEWVFGNGKDLTLFLGVSLGKLFNVEVTLCTTNFYRIERSLRKLIERFQPEEILYFDYKSEVTVLDDDLRQRAVASVARKYGIRLTLHAEASTQTPSEIADNPVKLGDHGPFVRGLLFLYTRFMEIASNLRCLLKKDRPRIFIYTVSNIGRPLFENFANRDLTPIFLVRSLPKRMGTLWRCLRYGVLLVTPKNIPLTTEDQTRLEEIHADLLKAFAEIMPRGEGGIDEITQSYVKKNILEPGRLLQAAMVVRAAHQLLERYKPQRILVDGEKNSPVRVYLELGKVRDISVDHTWHSPLLPKNLKLDALCGDAHSMPSVTRCLTWGTAHEAWLDTLGATQPRARIGCFVGDKYRRQPPDRLVEKRNALVLQYTPNLMDLRGLNTNQYGNFVDTVRLLREHGYENIRFKLHPGPGRWKTSYFESIAEFFNLECPILRREPFEDCVAWADIVIGPVHTGALYETLAAGKPYFAMLIPPHSMDESYYGDYPIYSSVDEFALALDQPPKPEAARKLLNALGSVDEYPSGSKRFWEVMHEDPG